MIQYETNHKDMESKRFFDNQSDTLNFILTESLGNN